MSTGTETSQRRRRLRLTPMRSIPVEFTGERAGEGPLALGQLDLYDWLIKNPDHLYAILCVELPVPAVVSVDDVAGATAALIARHETLRTTYVPGEPPRQQVAGAGVQLLEVCSLGEGQWGPRDRPAVAEALVQWLRGSPDPTRRPVRVAVAIAPDAGDRVIACAAAFTHIAVDNGSIEILKRDFAGLLGDPARRQAGRPGHQPLDQAELEATPVERRRADAALDYLREQSRRIPGCLYALPGARASGESLAVELWSVAAAMAVRRVAARTRTSRSSIVLAAICAVAAVLPTDKSKPPTASVMLTPTARSATIDAACKMLNRLSTLKNAGSRHVNTAPIATSSNKMPLRSSFVLMLVCLNSVRTTERASVEAPSFMRQAPARFSMSDSIIERSKCSTRSATSKASSIALTNTTVTRPAAFARNTSAMSARAPASTP